MGTIKSNKFDVAFNNLLDRQEYLVTQANELARSFGNLKMLEHKALDFCFSFVKQGDSVDTVYRSSMADITKHLGLAKSGSNYTHVAVALKNLNKKTPLYIQEILPNGEKSILMTHLFSHMRIGSNGTFEFKFSEEVSPYVFELKKQYYSFKLRELGRVRSKYTLIMLKLWNAHSNKWTDYSKPNSLPPNLYLSGSLDEWESWFLGYKEDKNDKEIPIRWPAGQFKRDVLDKALKELAELYPKSMINLTTNKNGRRVVGYTLEIRQINSTLDTNTVVIDGKPQSPRAKGKQGVKKEEKSIPTNVSEKVSGYNVEEQNELSEVEKLKQKIAELEAKVNSKPKEIKGLFEDTDLKKSEKKITDNLDKMTGKSPQDFEQTDLFE